MSEVVMCDNCGATRSSDRDDGPWWIKLTLSADTMFDVDRTQDACTPECAAEMVDTLTFARAEYVAKHGDPTRDDDDEEMHNA